MNELSQRCYECLKPLDYSRQCTNKHCRLFQKSQPKHIRILAIEDEPGHETLIACGNFEEIKHAELGHTRKASRSN